MKNYKVFVINLKKDEERMVFMNKQLKELGIEYERLEAINGKEYIENKLGDEYDEQLAIKKYGTKLTKGEIGCALSHKRCYQKFLEINKNNPEIKYCLIFEDDVEINKYFKEILEKCIRENEENNKWDYLQFSYPIIPNIVGIIIIFFTKFIWQYRILIRCIGLKNKIKRIPFLFFAPIVSLFLDFRLFILKKNQGLHSFFLRNQVLAGGYLLSKNTCSELLKLTDKISYPIDTITSIHLYKCKNIKCFYYTPRIVCQNNNFTSTIDELEKRI